MSARLGRAAAEEAGAGTGPYAVEALAGTVATAAGVFVGTNIDDLVVLTVLFLSARAGGRPKRWHVWMGQYAGIGTLVAVSAAALGLRIVPDQWVGLLGLVPLGLGMWGLGRAVRARNHEAPPPPTAASGLGPVIVVTIANGGDNVSAYTPLFRTIGLERTVITAVVFAALVAVWCLLGSRLGSHEPTVEVVERYGHWIVPVVLMIIGGVILAKSGVVALLVQTGSS